VKGRGGATKGAAGLADWLAGWWVGGYMFEGSSALAGGWVGGWVPFWGFLRVLKTRVRKNATQEGGKGEALRINSLLRSPCVGEMRGRVQ
jgi:hypothetical protein